MGIKCECDFDFRLKHNRFIAAFFLTLGFTLSFLSNLDCFFVEVDVGFVPQNSVYRTQKFGIGLWTFEDPDVRGQCITPLFVSQIGGLTTDDELYSNIFLNGDIFWGSARVIATFGLLVGFISMIYVWVCLCIDSKSEHQILITIIVTSVALACEGTKFGLFFDVQPCTKDDFWKNIDEDENEEYRKALSCLLSRGTYMSTFALLSYTFTIVYLIIVRMYPDYNHVSMEDGFDYDDVTLPSFLGSIGKSVTSKLSKTSSAMSSKMGSTHSSGEKTSSTGSSGYNKANPSPGQNVISFNHNVMAPIIEGDDDDEDFVDQARRGQFRREGSRHSKGSKGSRGSRGSGKRGGGSYGNRDTW